MNLLRSFCCVLLLSLAIIVACEAQEETAEAPAPPAEDVMNADEHEAPPLEEMNWENYEEPPPPDSSSLGEEDGQSFSNMMYSQLDLTLARMEEWKEQGGRTESKTIRWKGEDAKVEYSPPKASPRWVKLDIGKGPGKNELMFYAEEGRLAYVREFNSREMIEKGEATEASIAKDPHFEMDFALLYLYSNGHLIHIFDSGCGAMIPEDYLQEEEGRLALMWEELKGKL